MNAKGSPTERKQAATQAMEKDPAYFALLESEGAYEGWKAVMRALEQRASIGQSLAEGAEGDRWLTPRHLHAVDPYTGEVLAGGCPDCKALEMELRTKRSQITKLKNENARLMGVEPDHDQILEVCEFHRRMVVPNGSVTVASKGWTTVRARLRETHPKTGAKLFNPLRLRAGVCGIALDAWHMAARPVPSPLFGERFPGRGEGRPADRPRHWVPARDWYVGAGAAR